MRCVELESCINGVKYVMILGSQLRCMLYFGFFVCSLIIIYFGEYSTSITDNRNTITLYMTNS